MIDPNKPIPTLEGINRYPPHGYYDREPCTCNPDCEYSCRGECNCKACAYAYADYLADQEDEE